MDPEQQFTHVLAQEHAQAHAEHAEHNHEHMDEVRNELALPRVEHFDETRAARALRAIVSLARGSARSGSTVKAIRDALVRENKDTEALIEPFFSPQFKPSARKAAANLVNALAAPDDECPLTTDTTTRQESLCKDARLFSRLVFWLQAAVACHEVHSSDPEVRDDAKDAFWARQSVKQRVDPALVARPPRLSPRSGKAAPDLGWKVDDRELCLLVCQCLRSLCVCGWSATQISDAGAVPPLLTVVKHAPLDCMQAAAGVLLSIAIWRSHLIALHGGIQPFVRMLEARFHPLCRLIAVQILSQLANDPDDAVKILEAGGTPPLLALALDGKGQRNVPGGFEMTVKSRQGALWTLARLACHPPCIEILSQNYLKELSDIVLAGLDVGEAYVSKSPCESSLVLLKQFVSAAATSDENLAWGRELAVSAAPFVVSLLSSADNSEAVRAAAATCAAEIYATNAERRLVALGGSGDDVDVDDKGSRIKKKKDGGFKMKTDCDDESRDVHLEPGEYVHLVYGTRPPKQNSTSKNMKKQGRRGAILLTGSIVGTKKSTPTASTAPAPQLVVVFDASERAVLNSSNTPSNSRVPRAVTLEDGVLRWQPREEATGEVARVKRSSFNQTTANEVPVSRGGELDCVDIADCAPATADVLVTGGVPDTADIDVETCFVARTNARAVFFSALAPAKIKRNRLQVSRELRGAWISALLAARDEAIRAKGLKKRRRAAKINGAASKKGEGEGERSSRSSATERMKDEINPRKWEDAVMAHAAESSRERHPDHPDAIGELFKMATHPTTSATLSERGLAALLNLCSEPRVNRYVRDAYVDDLLAIPTTVSTGPSARDEAVSAKKFELLVLLNQIDVVEENLFRLRDAQARRAFRKVVLSWRRYLGYKALSDIKDLFDSRTLRELQDAFAEIDQDGSGYISVDELGEFFRRLSMPLTKKQIAEIVEEVDVDGNGAIDFEEFLLVVKTLESTRKIQSRLGVALSKASTLGIVTNFLKDTTGRSSAPQLREAFASTRATKQRSNDAARDDETRDRYEMSDRYDIRRQEMRRRWDRCAQTTFAAAKRASVLGQVSLDGVFRALAEEPQLVEGLGFVYKDRRVFVNETGHDRKLARRLAAAYEQALERAGHYDVLCRCADDAQLNIRGDLDYAEFETALWRVVREFRRAEAAISNDEPDR
ncbi:hypothetical protein CTAYLR_005143 [Chrysophaeum taylorii]|uniref:EF-hand domain-containing protein n=1 Tax=Chrysophaeum taylorii TaxID=2483200 RepID=A0AAD7UES8_9STRA|nr:hypothetical protein CTAYLR_005143 [Chrysophaeum taylorii]